jgi:hypothetical protein
MSQYAWVMLVMSKVEYFMGALVCAKSLKDNNTIYPIILMVGDDIVDYLVDQRELLLTVFDDIVIVPIIEQPTTPMMSTQQQLMYSNWISKSFTKWNCLAFYKDSELYPSGLDKVILVDVDMLFTSNCDELFELNAPAGCFSQPWAIPYHKNGAPNPYMNSNKKWKLDKDIPHGATIKHEIISQSLIERTDIMNKTLKPTFAVGAFMVLLEPNADDYRLLLDIVMSNEIYGKNNPYLRNKDMYSISGADETAISLLYAHKRVNFTHIHQKFAAILWKEQWSPPIDARVIHYFGKTKPWNMHVDEYPDLKKWWDIADSLCSSELLGELFPQREMPINNMFKQIFYPEYEPNPLDIAVAEYELTKDVQKMVVNYLTSISLKTNKSELWKNAKLFVNALFAKTCDRVSIDVSKLSTSELYDLNISSLYNHKWHQFLNTEYSHNDFKFITVARIFFNRWINEIKAFVSNRIQLKPRQITIEIKKNEILLGNHIKINKTEEMRLKINNDENIYELLIFHICNIE